MRTRKFFGIKTFGRNYLTHSMSKCLTFIANMKLLIPIAALIVSASAGRIYTPNAAESYAHSAEIYQSGLEQQQQGLYNSQPHVAQAHKYEDNQRPTGEKAARILGYETEHDRHQYKYVYETENGIKAQEAGETSEHGTTAQGAYSYTGDDGHVYTVTYTADEHGFHPQGDHLPTPPPIPEEIRKSLEQNAHDEANGVFDNGQYKGLSVDDTTYETTHGPSQGSIHGPTHSSDNGFTHVSTHGSSYGSTHGSSHAPTHGSTQDSAHSPTHGAVSSQSLSLGAFKTPIHVTAHGIGQDFSHNTIQTPSHSSAHTSQATSQSFTHPISQTMSHGFIRPATQTVSHGFTYPTTQTASHSFNHPATQSMSHGFTRPASQTVSHGFTQPASHGFTQPASHGFIQLTAQTASHGAAQGVKAVALPSHSYQKHAGYQTHYQPPSTHY